MKYDLVFVSSAERYQPPYYGSSVQNRIFNLADYYRRRGYATVVLSQNVFEKNYAIFETADRIVFHHPEISERMVRYLMNNKEKQIIIADYDDLVFDVSSAVSNFAALDRGEDLTPISRYIAAKAEIGQMFENRTASTVPLAEEATRIMGGRTKILYNALDPLYLDMAKRIFKLRDPFQVKYAFGYISDTPSQTRDLATISAPIADYLSEFPNDRMMMVGPAQIPSELKPFEDQITRKEVQSYCVTPSLIAQCRTILLPLASNKYTRCESSSKFFEVAAVGVGFAATTFPDIDRFESPLLHKCTNSKEWETALRASVHSGTHLEQEVQRLRAEVSLDRQASLWRDHFLKSDTHVK